MCVKEFIFSDIEAQQPASLLKIELLYTYISRFLTTSTK